VDALLDDSGTNPFLNDIRAIGATFAWYGALNSVSRVLLHFTVPGVPDIYQGDEIADLSLVDPDNRRPVDYDLRRSMLRSFETLAGKPIETQAEALRAMLAAPQEGRLKLWVSWKALKLRERGPELFARGDYVAVPSLGSHARHVVAFARRLGDQTLVAVAPRMLAQMDLVANQPAVGEPAWADTALDLAVLPPGSRLSNVLTGEVHFLRDQKLQLGAALAQLPVGLFVVEKQPDS
jgi:(1->4)-alpha-D-glucan 1-alpha-D-glucosylmutase